MEIIISIYNVIQWIFVFIDFILIGSFLFLLPLAITYRPDLFPRRPNTKATTLSRTALREQWDAIKAHLNDGNPANARLAVIEADKLIDYILKESGFRGEHMADRMEKLSSHGLQTFEKLWRAHKVRNEIVHSVGFEISESDIRQAIDDYESFLKEVRIIY